MADELMFNCKITFWPRVAYIRSNFTWRHIKIWCCLESRFLALFFYTLNQHEITAWIVQPQTTIRGMNDALEIVPRDHRDHGITLFGLLWHELMHKITLNLTLYGNERTIEYITHQSAYTDILRSNMCLHYYYLKIQNVSWHLLVHTAEYYKTYVKLFHPHIGESKQFSLS
jgi:hypothetical protein